MSRTAVLLGLLVGVGSCQSVSSSVDDEVTFSGTLRAGSDLGEVKRHCEEGLYLVADEGTYLRDQATMLLLRVEGDGRPLYADRARLNQRVEVIARDDVNRAFCDALVCACEDYLLVDSVRPTGQ